MLDSAEIATPLKSITSQNPRRILDLVKSERVPRNLSQNSNSSVHIQTKPKSQFEFIPRDTEKSEFLGLVDFGDVAI